MAGKHKPQEKSTVSWFEKLLGRSAGKRIARKSSEEFRKLGPIELKGQGLSPRSERYVEKSAKRITSSTPTLSKRQFQEKKLSEAAGRRVTLEQRTREYLTGERQAATAAQASNRERSLQSWTLRKKYKNERASRIREHLRNMEIKAQGDQLNWDVCLREKAFAEAHMDVPEEQGFYQKWFNYGHVKHAARGGHNATGRTSR
jgi:hypothetical protein